MREQEYFKNIPVLTRMFRYDPNKDMTLGGAEKIHSGINKGRGPTEGSYNYVNRTDIPGYKSIHNFIMTNLKDDAATAMTFLPLNY